MQSPIEGTVEIDTNDIWMDLEDKVDDVIELKIADQLEDFYNGAQCRQQIMDIVKEEIEDSETLVDAKALTNVYTCIRHLHQQVIELKQALEFANSALGHDFGWVAMRLKDNPENFWDIRHLIMNQSINTKEEGGE